MKLNCDIGEGFGTYKIGNDEEIMPLIDLASIACGFHASDSVLMDKTVRLAKANGVSIGAHPSYPDLAGFGRRSMQCLPVEIQMMSLYQISALFGFCKANAASLDFVKPHGALYNDMMKNEEIFRSILRAVKSFDSGLKLMILSTSQNDKFEKTAQEFGVDLLFEVFADRNYTDDGFLVSRTQKNALIKDKKQVLDRLLGLKTEGILKSVGGKKIPLKADCICVHSDNEEALDLVRFLKENL